MNPASRLHSVLVSFKSIQGDNRPIRHVIAEIFHISDVHSPEVIRNYASLISLAIDVESRITSIPGIKYELYCRGVRNIIARLAASHIDTDLFRFRDKITSEDLHSLEFISDMLDGIEREDEIAPAQLATLLAQIDGFLSEISKARLDADFKHFLFSHLTAVRVAVSNYQIFGAVGMRAAMARVIGELILDPPNTGQSAEKKGLLQRTLNLIKDVNQVVTFFRHGHAVVKELKIDELLKLNN